MEKPSVPRQVSMSEVLDASMETGADFDETINDNMLVVMLESVEAANNAYEIAVQPGVDVVILGNSDMSNFSGFSRNSPEYHDLQIQIRNAAYTAAKFYGNASSSFASDNPLAANSRLHQNGPSNDGWSRDE